MEFQVQDLLGKCSMSYATVRSLIKKSFFFFVIVWLVLACSSGTLAAGKNNNIKEYGIVILPQLLKVKNYNILQPKITHK
ncbi:MAG: hypothetical protein ACEY3E_04725 [Candidatus Tisiphia sp.]